MDELSNQLSNQQTWKGNQTNDIFSCCPDGLGSLQEYLTQQKKKNVPSLSNEGKITSKVTSEQGESEYCALNTAVSVVSSVSAKNNDLDHDNLIYCKS